MKMVRKIGWLLVVLALLAGSVMAEPAAEAPQLSLDQCNVLAGATVEYRISISGNPGLAAMQLQLEYDTSVLTPVTYENSKEVICERGSFSSQGTVSGALTSRGCRFLWYHTSNVNTDGTVLTFRFQVSDQAAPGVYPVRISARPWDVTDRDGNQVPVQMVDGAVEVHSYCPMLYTEDRTVYQGEEFDYPVKIMDNPGLASLQINLIFDKTKFELVQDAQGDMICSLGENFSTGTLQTKQYGNAAVGFWFQATNATKDGTFITVRLRAKETAEAGEAAMKLQYLQSLDENEQPVSFTVKTGTVRIMYFTEVAITQNTDQTLKVTVTGPVGMQAVAAVYDETGRLVQAEIISLTGKPVDAQINTNTSLLRGTCRVMLVDPQFSPICEATDQTIS